MIHKPNEVIRIPENFMSLGLSRFNTPEQAIGLAVDALVKFEAHYRLGAPIPGTYEPYDFSCGDLLYEIKSTCRVSFSFSQKEYLFIKDRVENDKQHKTLFYSNNPGDLSAPTTVFLGSINTSVFFERNLFDDNGLGPFVHWKDVLAILHQE